MSIWGELEHDEIARAHVGFDDDWYVEITEEAWSGACHVMTMRGIDRRQWWRQLFDVLTWLNDEALRVLEGVETVPGAERNSGESVSWTFPDRGLEVLAGHASATISWRGGGRAIACQSHQ